MLKRTCMLMALALLLCAVLNAWAEGGVNVEVIRADGVSVVVLTPEETMERANSAARDAWDERRADAVLPKSLTIIEEGAFEGISARCVEITENVIAIEGRAFADCKTLREIHIPATVVKVDDHALEGCERVTVYGVKGTEAERFAAAAGFKFVDTNEGPVGPIRTPAPPQPPVGLPLVPRQ